MRLLGKTNMKVNRVGFGGIPIQRITQEETNKVINELIDKNVNFIDTARAYTISEEYIGNAIEGKREKFFIATKSMARDYESMKQDIEISLKNLKTDYIDLYQIHNLKPEEYKTIFDENKAYKALLEAKEENHKYRAEVENELKERRNEVLLQEKRMIQREKNYFISSFF